MGCDGLSDISAGADEGVGSMMNGAGLTSGLLQGREPIGVAVLWGQRLVSTMSWRRLGVFRKVTDGGLVRRSWVDGSEERMWKPYLRIRLRQ